MKIAAPKPFIWEAGPRAVLLLHGFTGSSKDVKGLGKYLHERGYTCYAPVYRGHGEEPEKLLSTDPWLWWQDALEGYHFLQNKGFEQIAVAGVSLGGLFSLRLGTELPVQAIVSMCSPLKEKSVDELLGRVLHYATFYKQLEGKDANQIDAELKTLERIPATALNGLKELIWDTGKKLPKIVSPTFVAQGRMDDTLYRESAPEIYREIRSNAKLIKWYERSGHILTLDEERETVFEDVYRFLESIPWSTPPLAGKL